MAANIGSNRSPSPISSRTFRNSETNSSTRRSFNGNPFNRPTPTPANTPTTADHSKRLMVRKSTGGLFQDGKENHKDVNVARSPVAKTGTKNFMAPTISAASKFTPSPRKKILGEKNDVTRSSGQFFDKETDLKAESVTFDDVVEQKETVLEVTFNSSNDATEMLSDVTENNDFVKIRPFCCSPITSPIIAPTDSDPHLPPYDPKKNFLSPRPQYLRYKPNPRIELLLNKEGSDDSYGEEDVTRLEDSFNLSEENSSDNEVDVEQEQETEGELDESVHGSSELSSEVVSEEKESDSDVIITPKAKFFTRSKTVSFIFLMFLVACFSVSFTDLPPMDLPIYQDVGFSEIYYESLKFAGIPKESVDDLVENVKNWSSDFVSYLSHQKSQISFDDIVENVKSWSIDFVSYLSHQKSQLFSTHKTSSIQFFNLTTSHVQEEFVFNRHIGTDYILDLNEESQESEEEMQEFDEEMEVYDDVDVEDEVLIDDINVEEVMIEEINEVQPDEQIKTDVDAVVETKVILEDGPVIESQPETEMNDREIESNDESETLSSLLTKSVDTICLASFLMVIMAASSIFYMMKRKSNATTKTAKIHVADGENDTSTESYSAESSSVDKGSKKKSVNNKRESLASSSSDFSMSCSPSYGSFTTFERIPIKHKDEVMLTPIRRSSRLLKAQVTS